MINPPLNDLLKKVDCRYTLVSIISKRARQIVEQSNKNEESLTDKAVSYAVVDLMTDKLSIKGRDDLKL